MSLGYTAFKSSSSIIKHFTALVKEHVLNPDEILLDRPTTFINLLGNTIGELNSASFYEQLMYRGEILPSTAQKLKSLLRHLDQRTLSSVLAQPSGITIILGYKESDILSRAIPNANGTRSLRINKDFKFYLFKNGAEFTLDHDIEIVVSETTVNGIAKNSIYAMYDISDATNGDISIVNNPFIPSRERVLYDDEHYFIMFITVRQYTRTEKIIEINSEMDIQQNIPFSNKLAGFQVLYKAINGNAYSDITCLPVGQINPSGCNYEYSNTSDGYLKISFSNIPGYFYPTTGTIKVVIYTTLGASANKTLSNVDSLLNEMDYVYKQDRSDLSQEAILSIKPLLSIRETRIYGGVDNKSFDQIKELVINRNSLSKVITPSEFDRVMGSSGLTVKKIRDDIRAMEFRVSSVLANTSGGMIPTSLVDLSIPLSDIDMMTEIRARMIKPTSVYRLSNQYCDYIKNKNTIGDFIDKYNKNETNDFMFPYHLRLETDDDLRVNVYNMNTDNAYLTDFIFFNNVSTDKLSIMELDVYRDVNDPLYEDKYRISFTMSANQLLVAQYLNYLNNINNDPAVMKFKIVLHNKLSTDSYVLDIDKSNISVDPKNNQIVKFVAYVQTNSGISSFNRIAITNDNDIFHSVPVGQPTARINFLDEKIDISLVGFLLTPDGTPRSVTVYDKYLTDNERQIGYYNSVVYKASDVVLFENLTDRIRINVDMLVAQPTYETYQADVYDYYTENVYELGPDGTPRVIYETIIDLNNNPIQVPKYVIAHKVGSTKRDTNGNPVIKYHAGEYQRDLAGQPIPKSYSQYVCILHGVPVYNRIYSYGGNRQEVLTAYQLLLDKIQAQLAVIPDGCSLSLGVFRTSGIGDYYYLDRVTGNFEPLNNINLSFKIGVKLTNSTTTDLEYIRSLITNEIIKYVTALTEEEFSVNKMLNYIKQIINLIDYFEVYSVNDYPSNICQTIYYKPANTVSSKEQLLSVKYVVDLNNSDIATEQIMLKPDIDITFL